MNAVISGRAAVALMIDGEQLYSIHYDAPEERVERALEEWNLLLAGATDLEFVEACDEATVRDRLEDAVDSTESLDLVLCLFDGSLSDDTRRTASLELDELLVYPEITAYLESILYARPLGQSADTTGARRCCDAEATNTLRLIDELIGQQKAVSVARAGFESACQEIAGKDEASQVESACLRAGLFARFVRAGGNSNAINGVLMSALQDRTLLQRLSADLLRHTLTAWAKNIRELWEQDRPQRQEKQESQTSAGSSEREDGAPRGKVKRRKSYDRGQAKFNVDSQKERVVDLLKRRKFAQARRVIDEVVGYNLEHGGTEYACKTLCSLAKAAQDLGLCSLQLELTERSVALDGDDG